ncbi:MULTISPECIES: translation elongation factor Ts [Roseobacteraceae]|jgi:elongation factor Ts|uniref:Elongation factor Ts n=2 Tax=Celeribacter baekdonensis TaxID=875171 RepID=K2JBJ9_9RHOB|nr:MULTISPECIES: translation elongation factor Ts [Roseobacteraceae]MBU0644902.1 translation elongation factor Ts [Alphaproteobacteria bacterium]EKE72498.1 elongation factor Ts [Celeribacter baekdonensis B30]KAB6715409.1 elongation factor Ts [Roseobacter sp. TSBP12]MBU1280460.1 translation elongation factor Ts [Alphaproteobacteria bacterium]MBU1572256.1 translation elongation factor Ts [Alphaproteobacteria bacterium]|tara:strand:- start:5619 stop:6494 length:876 start_codon:yes stop_codon:yes gene_type:complete
MAITAAMVKELREATAAGMMDAKKALTETDGDFEAAVDWLRTKGLAKAAKKAGRTAAEGLVGVAVDGGVGVAVEVNSETDFVGKNAEFQAMVKDIASAALAADDLEALNAAEVNGKAVSEIITDKIATIGENMGLRRMAKIEAASVVTYVHNAAADGMGKIGVLVGLNGANDAFGKQVAMHIAAANPAALGEADLDPAIVEKEKQVQIDIARESGKPENIIENMIKGRMAKFIAESTLLGQAFVVNPDLTVEAAAKEAGVEITGFVRLEVGEGIEKVAEDFAAEVAKAAQG